MGNPIAILLRPSRALLLCFGLMAGYGALMLSALDVDESPVTDASDITRVELLK
jgi:hypothetical protein